MSSINFPSSPSDGDVYSFNSRTWKYSSATTTWVNFTGNGFTGSKGDIGFTGSKGDIGFTGSQGVIGFTGSAGFTGSKGDIGFTGSRGATGFTGSQGAQGAQGVIGFTGSQGAQGAQGVIGFTGSQGAQGVIGFTGSQGIIGFTGSQGVIGFTGSRGADGNFGGATFDYTFDTSTTASDPGTGRIRFNNANVSLATAMYIDASNDAATDISAFLNTIDDSTSTIKGHFRVSNRLDASDFALYTISALTNNTGWFTVSCAHVSGSSTSFTNLEDIIITFARTGDIGSTGFTGSVGFVGSKGDLGFTGSQGAGFTGSQGAQGVIGFTGSQGAQGVIGFTGSLGAQGPQGPIGFTGSAGPIGGTNTQVIFNDSGVANGSASFTFNKTTGITTHSANVAMANNYVTSPSLQAYKEFVSAVSITTTTSTLDLATTNIFNLSMANNVTLTFSNPPTSGIALSFTLYCKQDAIGSRVITWPATVRWPNASPPTMSTGANKVDVFSFFTLDGGTTYLGALSLANTG